MSVTHRDAIKAQAAAIAATVHRAYRDRAATIHGQLAGHELQVGVDYIVLMPGGEFAVSAQTVPGGCDVTVGDQVYAIRHDWRFGEILMRGTCNGTPFAVQVERR